MLHSSRVAAAALAVLAWAAFAAGACAQATGSPERGYKLYMHKMCYTCHGTVGQGGERGTGPRIAPSDWPFDAFAQYVRQPARDMPRYSARFTSDDELRDIHAYLASIKPGRPARDIDLLK